MFILVDDFNRNLLSSHRSPEAAYKASQQMAHGDWRIYHAGTKAGRSATRIDTFDMSEHDLSGFDYNLLEDLGVTV
jgi:hypothetical protein